jgi:hypothetical protein
MYVISIFLLGILFKNFMGIEATDLVKIPLGADWQVSLIDFKQEILKYYIKLEFLFDFNMVIC